MDLLHRVCKLSKGLSLCMHRVISCETLVLYATLTRRGICKALCQICDWLDYIPTTGTRIMVMSGATWLLLYFCI